MRVSVARAVLVRGDMHLRTLFVALPLMLVPAAAHAQSIAVANQTSLARVDASGALVAKRPRDLHPEGVSRRDCDEDQKIRFSLVLSGFAPNATLSAWTSTLGVDCAQPANRANGLCTSIAPALPLMPNLQVDIPVRRLVATAAGEPGTANVCGTVDVTSVDVQFLYFGPGANDLPATKTSLVIDVDTIGPPPPRDVRARQGDGKVTVSWERVDGTVGMSAYCEASPSTRLIAGAIPTEDIDATLRCGEVVGAVATALVVVGKDGAQPIENDAVLAVSATDAFGNHGPLSSPVTATPSAAAESDDASSGGCSAAPARSGASAAFLLSLGVLAIRSSRRIREARSDQRRS